MVRRGVRRAALAAAGLMVATGCERDRAMIESAEMPDSMPVLEALERAPAMDSMLDTMPGGEMSRGDSATAAAYLRDKIGH